jgi:hypothetical protein
LNQATNARLAPPGPLRDMDLIDHLRTQRHRIATLSSEAESLRARGRRLLAESNFLTERLDRSFTDLAGAFLANRRAVEDLRLHSSVKQARVPVRATSIGASEQLLADSPDLVDALQQATDILKMEFADTEGSGRETLDRCEKALQRTRSIRTIELPLY